jgi:lysophospholipid acyltransferase (LPLAT)-like uncharacterized protein
VKLPPALIAPPLYGLYKAWCATLRYDIAGRQAVDDLWHARTPMVFALWHDELFPLMHVRGDLEIVTVVSQSRDGEYLAQVLQRLGLRTARGSSSRGGVKALIGAARQMRKEGLCGCVTVDGPRGPRHKVKPGAIFLAQRAQAPIVPIRIFMERAKVFERAWDRFQLPLPFSRVRVVFGEPYRLPDAAEAPDAAGRREGDEGGQGGDAALAAASAELEARLEGLR